MNTTTETMHLNPPEAAPLTPEGRGELIEAREFHANEYRKAERDSRLYGDRHLEVRDEDKAAEYLGLYLAADALAEVHREAWLQYAAEIDRRHSLGL